MDNLILSQIPIEELIKLFRDVVKEELDKREPVTNSKSLEVASRPITAKQLSKYLSVTLTTVSRWKTSGKIPFIQMGSAVRFNLNDVLKVLEQKDKVRIPTTL